MALLLHDLNLKLAGQHHKVHLHFILQGFDLPLDPRNRLLLPEKLQTDFGQTPHERHGQVYLHLPGTSEQGYDVDDTPRQV